MSEQQEPPLPQQQEVDREAEKHAKKEARKKEQQKAQEQLIDETKALFNNLSNYLQSELLITSDDYKLLYQMNVLTKEKYVDMTKMTAQLATGMTELQAKYKAFQPYLAKIDEIETSVSELEKTVLALDDYTKKLEAKFQLLQRLAKNPYNKKEKVVV
jgi:biogenesis of lysosome-related organelles complex 1 subunit 2